MDNDKLPVWDTYWLYFKLTWETEIAAGDKPAGDGQDLRGGEGDVKSGGDSNTAVEHVQNSLVTGLVGQDRGRSNKELSVVNERRTTEVG